MRAIPQAVSDCSRSALEWDRFLDLLSARAQSAPGRQWLLALTPSADLAWIQREHTLVAEMRLLVAAGIRSPLAALIDPSTFLAKSRIEGVALEPDELRVLISLAADIAQWTALMRTPPESLAESIPGLLDLSRGLLPQPLDPLVASLRARLLPDGALADDASPELARIRRQMERQQRAIEDSLYAALRRYSEGGSTQDDLITIRGDRFVIPVKAEWKRRAQGVVHGSSSSGQTVYVEPLETIDLNNDLVRLLEDEQAEIHRIFVSMTREIARFADVIALGAEVLAEVDTLQARARFAQDFRCVVPVFSPADAPELALVNARHPLLEERLRRTGSDAAAGLSVNAPAPSIVPITLHLASDQRQLVISGPNTGGKSVSLKTAGLLALMAQSGIPVPAESATLPVFHAFLADIGDAQSIEQNLSTFSAHIVNLNRIAAAADAHSLVLLDELGSATDPDEGSALAVAIARHFLDLRAFTILSTHLTALKVYAENTPGVSNAAVGFDEHTLAPTYELRQGVPGASAGINIAARLGLNPAIVAAARARLGTQTEDIGRFLDRLHQQLRDLDAGHTRVREQQQELTRERQRLDAEGLKDWRAKVRQMEQQLASLLKDFEYQARETIRVIDDRVAQQKLSKDAGRRIARLRREFTESFNGAIVAVHTGADKDDAHAEPHIVRRVVAGDTVKLRTLGKSAVIQRQVDDKTFEVSVGPMKMRIARDEIAEVLRSHGAPSGTEKPLEAARSRRGISVIAADPSESLGWEINVIGRTADEARDEVEKFLDRAFLASLPRIRIVHGTGMGILRRTLRDWLRHHPQVAAVTEPPHNEGGAGVTIVEFKM